MLQFGIYICMMAAGLGVIHHPPSSFEGVLGTTLVIVFGGFIFFGAFLGAIAVLPGIWWLERTGLLALMTGMAMYTVIIFSLGTSTLGVAVSVAFVLSFIQRWSEIRRYQLAPREE